MVYFVPHPNAELISRRCGGHRTPKPGLRYGVLVSTKALSGLRRGLLLCALVLGVVAMHQLVTTDGTPEMASAAMASTVSMQPSFTADHDEMPGGIPHDLMHLCMAVLCSLAVAILLIAVRQRPMATPRPVSRSDARAPDRPPPIAGRLLLAQVCVLRQ